MKPLDDKVNLLDLVKKARSGCQESMNTLAQLAQRNVSAYIYRLTLDRHTTEDLQQETLLTMVKSLKMLENPDRFWAWLYRIALSKVQHYFRDCQHERQKMSKLHKEHLSQHVSASYGEGLKHTLDKELSQAVVDAMEKLKFRYRNILVLRCFERLPYSEIAKILDCREITAQVLFFRAKNSLKRKMTSLGFGSGMLLAALGLFGKMTAPADAAPVTMPASSTKVCLTATVIGAAGTRLGLTIITILAATALTVGSITSQNNTDSTAAIGDSKLPERSEVRSFHFVKQAWKKTGSVNPNLSRGRSLSKGAYEQWYYFPEGVDGPMFMMMQRWDPQQKNRLCGWLQNGTGNYYYHSGKKTIYLYNSHLAMRYLSTRRLPTDTSEFTEFLDQIEGKSADLNYIRDPKTGLLTGVLDNRFYNAKNFKSSISYNRLNQKSFDSFRYPWPKNAPVVDERDQMHKRGWTYFRITGQINGQQVQGWGQIPFIYNAVTEHWPWLKLNIGNKLKIVDSPSAAYLASPEDTVIAAYPKGSFFKGLAQPWMGMHTVDIIRRNAAENRVKFTIKNFGGDNEHYGKAEIMLFTKNSPRLTHKIVYIIDIDRDIIEKIEFLTNDGSKDKSRGILKFSHLKEIEFLPDEFTEPPERNFSKKAKRKSMGMLWLIELAQGTLGQ